MTSAAVQQKISPANRVEPVYVFGCRINDSTFNEGTAAVAARFHGAGPGVWNGRNGNAYAIPCRNNEGAKLPPKVFSEYLNEFIKYARANPTLQFRVARFGCEKGGYQDAEIAPLWRDAPSNCVLPAVWKRQIGVCDTVKMLIFDPLVRLKSTEWQTVLRRYLVFNLPLWGVTSCEFLSIAGLRDSPSTANAATQLGYRHSAIRADPRYYHDQADIASEMLAIWHATHLLGVTDPEQTSVLSHVRILNFATRDGLFVDDLCMDDIV